MELPRVLIVGSLKSKAEDIARKMGSKHLLTEDEVEYYVWDIDNKYYKAQVLLCVTENPLITIDLESVEALIIHYDTQSELGAHELDKWTPLISSFSETETLILTCDSVPPGPNRDQAIDWCSLFKFELVELESPESTDILDSQDDETDKHGIDRIIEALHAHAWPNMELKVTDSATSTAKTDVDINGVHEQLEGIHLNGVDSGSQSLKMDGVLEGIMGGENTDFGELFGQLLTMKEHAASLPVNHRRAAAEQLVTAFWKAMGGDPDEIDGLGQ